MGPPYGARSNISKTSTLLDTTALQTYCGKLGHPCQLPRSEPKARFSRETLASMPARKFRSFFAGPPPGRGGGHAPGGGGAGRSPPAAGSADPPGPPHRGAVGLRSSSGIALKASVSHRRRQPPRPRRFPRYPPHPPISQAQRKSFENHIKHFCLGFKALIYSS